MFERLTNRTLSEMAVNLTAIAQEADETSNEQVRLFASHLASLMSRELRERHCHDESED